MEEGKAMQNQRRRTPRRRTQAPAPAAKKKSAKIEEVARDGQKQKRKDPEDPSKYNKKVVQSYRCNKLGHNQEWCHEEQTCIFCAEPHH